MILAGLVILALLIGFVVSIIMMILELLAILIGIVLVLGGVAMLVFGRRFWRR